MKNDLTKLNVSFYLENFLKKTGLYEEYSDYKIFLNWEKIIGKEFAKNVRVVTFNQGVLFLEAKSNMWMSEINLREMDLINRINNYIKMKKVRKIVCRLGSF